MVAKRFQARVSATCRGCTLIATRSCRLRERSIGPGGASQTVSHQPLPSIYNHNATSGDTPCHWPCETKFFTAALTGSGSTQDRSDKVPRSPEQIATAAIDAANAGAAVVHCHVRDPETGAPDRAVNLYREVVERIRASDTDVVINLTAGMGDIVFGPTDAPLPLSEQGTDMVSAAERVAHLEACLPEIATLDCGTMNFAEADYVMTNTPGMLRDMASRMADLGIRIEIEAFDSGHLWLAQQLVSEGVIPAPVMVQLCMGIPWGAPDDLNTLMAMVNNVPPDWIHLPFQSAGIKWPMLRQRCCRGVTCAWGSRTTCGWKKATLPPTPSWWRGR